ncbi:MAG: four helix bundle protein [Eubacteriales bacterium]
MSVENTVKYKSKCFAIRIIRLYKFLTETKKEFVLSKQLLRSGTSIGSNLAEAECSISRKDFLAKIYIALKESAESLYWLELLHETKYISDTEFQSVYDDCIEIKKMLMATTKTMANKNSTLNSQNSTLI